jgi:hypothetical protein
MVLKISTLVMVIALAASPAQAQGARVVVADGAATYAVPAGWRQIDDNWNDLVIEKGEPSDPGWIHCVATGGQVPVTPDVTQDRINRLDARRAAKDFIEEGSYVVYFSPRVLNGARYFDVAFTRKGLTQYVRQYTIVRGKRLANIKANCATKDAGDPKVVAEIIAFEDSIVVK